MTMQTLSMAKKQILLGDITLSLLFASVCKDSVRLGQGLELGLGLGLGLALCLGLWLGLRDRKNVV